MRGLVSLSNTHKTSNIVPTLQFDSEAAIDLLLIKEKDFED